VLHWRLALKARALDGNQAEPVFLFSVGIGGSGKSLESNLTLAAWGGEASGYARTLPQEALRRSKMENSESPKATLLSLQHARYVCSHEVTSVDADVIKNLLGGNPISARGLHEKTPTMFLARFCCIESTLNPTADGWGGRISTRGDAGVARRARVCWFKTAFKDCASRAEAEALQRRWDSAVTEEDDPTDERDPTDRIMYREKHDELMSLAPDLMRLMIDRHMESTGPGGRWPEEPAVVKADTEAMLEELGVDGSHQEEPDVGRVFERNFERCGCVHAPAFHDDQFNVHTSQLHGWDAAKLTLVKCEHCVSSKEVADCLKMTRLRGGRTLFEQLQTLATGIERSRSHLPVVRHVCATLSGRHRAGANGDLLLQFDLVDKERKGGNRRHVLYGFVKKAAPPPPDAASAAAGEVEA